ncbi:hypothetical protein B0J17DRAFT_672041 [Rhizoctonia solani]|nr:hypothetical protein B0J17DRAFT_672041 [Rhizoctonia solani]
MQRPSPGYFCVYFFLPTLISACYLVLYSYLFHTELASYGARGQKSPPVSYSVFPGFQLLTSILTAAMTTRPQGHSLFQRSFR